MLSSRVNFGSTVNRKVEIGVGISLAIVALPFFLLGGAGIWTILVGENDAVLSTVAILGFVIGAFCIWTGVRLTLGLKRPDGGILSPFVLRLAAVFFAVGPIVLLLASDEFSWRSMWKILELVFYFSAAGACLLLANRRQHQTLGQNSVENDV
jgi:hypothetical protein